MFVANLPYQARAKDLKELFNSENANVVSAEIIFHENPRRSAGYGFVSFNTKQEAEAALSALQGKVILVLAFSAKFTFGMVGSICWNAYLVLVGLSV